MTDRAQRAGAPMIIPIGHENSEVRRLPWVTFAIMAICTLTLFHTQSQESALEQELVQITEELGAYVQEHPWLELDARVGDMLFSDYDDDERAELLAGWAEELEQPFEFEVEAQQRELDALTERFLGVYDAHPFRRLGLVPAQLGSGGWLTHQFVHGGWMHLIGNLFLLFLAGACIEDVWGRPLFAAFYLLSGIAGAGLFAARYPDLTIPLVGASGAVSGVLGAFLVRYWSTRIKFFYWIGLFYRGTFLAPAWLMLPLWFANELASAQLMDALLPGTGGGGVAHWAHVGGFAFGVGGALAIRQLRVEERWIAPNLERKTSYVQNAAVEQAASQRAAGNAQAAFDTLTRELRAQPANYDASLALWDVARELGRPRDAAAALGRVIRHDVQEGDPLRALSRLAELDQHVPGAPVEPLVLLRLASALANAGRADAVPGVLRRAVPDGAAPLPTAVALRIANATRTLDPVCAARAARIALGARDLDPRERPGLEAIARAAPESADAHATPATREAAGSPRAPEPIELPETPTIASHDDEEPAVAPESAEKPAAWSLDDEDSKLFDFGRTIDLSVEEDVPPPRAAEPTPAERNRPQTALELSDASALDLSGDDSAAAPGKLDLDASLAADTSARVVFEFQEASALDLSGSDETRVIASQTPGAPGGADDRTRAMPRPQPRRPTAPAPVARPVAKPAPAPAASSDDLDLSDEALAELTAQAERALEGGAGFLRPSEPDDEKD
jgi:membrane associated rhomboid family serine protease